MEGDPDQRSDFPFLVLRQCLGALRDPRRDPLLSVLEDIEEGYVLLLTLKVNLLVGLGGI